MVFLRIPSNQMSSIVLYDREKALASGPCRTLNLPVPILEAGRQANREGVYFATMVVPRSALIIVNYAKTDLDGRGEMGLALRELASRKEKFDRIHLHARIVKSEAVRRKSEEAQRRAIEDDKQRALVFLQKHFEKYGAKLTKESGTTIERDATLCEGGQLDDYITSVVKSRGRDFDVIVVGIKLEDSKKPGILSSFLPAPGAVYGQDDKAETLLECVSKQLQTSIYHIYNKEAPRFKRYMYTPAAKEPAAEAPIAEAPAAEVPATEVPATEVPATETPAAEAPAAEVPAIEVPAPAAEAPAAEVPAGEVPAPAAQVPVTDGPAAEVPAVHVLAAEVPPAEVPAADVVPESSPVESLHSTPPQAAPSGLQESRSLPREGPIRPHFLENLQSSSDPVPSVGPSPRAAAFRPTPSGYSPGQQYFPAFLRSPGHTGPVSRSHTGPARLSHTRPVSPGNAGPASRGETRPVSPGHTGPASPNYTGPISPGHTGPLSPPANFSGYRYGEDGHGEPSATEYYPFHGTPAPPQFVPGDPYAGPHHGPPAPGYGHNHPGYGQNHPLYPQNHLGYDQYYPGYGHIYPRGPVRPLHMYGAEYAPGHPWGTVYPPEFVATQDGPRPSPAGDPAYMHRFAASPGEGPPVGHFAEQQPAASPAGFTADSIGRATPSVWPNPEPRQLSPPTDLWPTAERQPAEDQTGPAEPAGATHEPASPRFHGRASSRELQSYEGYSLQELTDATNNFSQELGRGGFGIVYLGTFRGTQVAVKKMNPEGLQGPAQFEREVRLLTTLRHRNIVILMGCCPEDFCLVYEYCAQGSVEERLADDTRPLPWYTRVRIMLEIATAVLWMHKHGFIHCDIKLANMLLDQSNTAKLGDVGISRMIPSAQERTARLTGALTSLCTSSGVRGSFGYVDPALFDGYPLEEGSDVYALGICLLQLLTKLPAGSVKREVKQAYNNRNMRGILDRSAGEWLLGTVVEDLAALGIRCTEYDQDKRPNLETEIIPVLARLNSLGRAAERQEMEGLRRVAAEMEALRLPGARPLDHSDIMENSFCCPISKELMEDPVVAADGHTYERRKIERWLAESCTSPVTLLLLPHTNLVANHAVKSAIMEWRQRTGR